MKKLTCLVFTFLVLSVSVYAQSNYVEGYIITPEKDTITGLINDQNWAKNPRSIFFKRTPDSKAINYSPVDVSGFYIKPRSEYYQSYLGKVDDSVMEFGDLIHVTEDAGFFQKDYDKTDTIFLRTILKGEISLYIHRDKKDRIHFFLETRNNAVTELVNQTYLLDLPDRARIIRTNKAYQRQLNDALQNCKSLDSEFANVDYTQKSLLKLVNKYYECINSSSTYVYHKEGGKVEMGAMVGLSASSLQVSNPSGTTDYGTSINPVVGLGFNFVIPRNRESLSFYTDLLWRQLSYKGEIKTPTGNLPRELKASYIKFDILLRYTIPSATLKKRAFFNIGLANNFVVQMKQNIFWDGFTVDNRPHEQGILGGVGMRFNKWQAEIRHERGNGMSPYSSWSSPVRSWYLLFNYQFK